jgi:hypothetical protein
MEEVPIPGQEAEVREMDVNATKQHEHPQRIEEDAAAVMGQQTVSTFFYRTETIPHSVTGRNAVSGRVRWRD